MKVLELKSNKLIEVNDSFGERLIGHGMAILPPAARPGRAPAQKADKPGSAQVRKAEKADDKKSGDA